MSNRSLVRLAIVVALPAALLLTACQPRFVVLRDVPESPQFTVIPETTTGANIAFANQVSGALVACRMKVIERPSMMSGFSDTKGKQSGSAVGTADFSSLAFGSASSSTRSQTYSQNTDVVDLYSQTAADYIMVVNADNTWVKMIKRETKEIIFSSALHIGQEGSMYEHEMHNLLVAAGLLQEKGK